MSHQYTKINIKSYLRSLPNTTTKRTIFCSKFPKSNSFVPANKKTIFSTNSKLSSIFNRSPSLSPFQKGGNQFENNHRSSRDNLTRGIDIVWERGPRCKRTRRPSIRNITSKIDVIPITRVPPAELNFHLRGNPFSR